MKRIAALLKQFKDKSFARYVIIGVITQLLDLGTYTLLVSIGVNYVIADTINNPLVLGFNYLGHKYFSFRKNPWDNKEVGRYLLNLLINYLYTTAILILLTSVLAVHPVVSKVITMILIPAVNYILLKKLVFVI